jgi:hypothetical protein
MNKLSSGVVSRLLLMATMATPGLHRLSGQIASLAAAARVAARRSVVSSPPLG